VTAAGLSRCGLEELSASTSAHHQRWLTERPPGQLLLRLLGGLLGRLLRGLLLLRSCHGNGSLLMCVRYSGTAQLGTHLREVPRSILCTCEGLSQVISLATSERASLDPGRTSLASLLVLARL